VHDRVSHIVAALLAHRAGFAAFNAFTFTWFTLTLLLPAWLGLPEMPVFVVSLAGYLDVVTWFGGATQFTLAYQNKNAEVALHKLLTRMAGADDLNRQVLLTLRQTLENQEDILATLLELARQDNEAGERLEQTIRTLDDEIERLTVMATDARKQHLANARLIRRIIGHPKPG
jgi:hypothetical protein